MVINMFRACQICLIQPFTKRRRNKTILTKSAPQYFWHSSLNLSFSHFAQGWIIKFGEDTEQVKHYSPFLNFLAKNKRIPPTLNRLEYFATGTKSLSP